MHTGQAVCAEECLGDINDGFVKKVTIMTDLSRKLRKRHSAQSLLRPAAARFFTFCSFLTVLAGKWPILSREGHLCAESPSPRLSLRVNVSLSLQFLTFLTVLTLLSGFSHFLDGFDTFKRVLCIDLALLSPVSLADLHPFHWPTSLKTGRKVAESEEKSRNEQKSEKEQKWSEKRERAETPLKPAGTGLRRRAETDRKCRNEQKSVIKVVHFQHSFSLSRADPRSPPVCYSCCSRHATPMRDNDGGSGVEGVEQVCPVCPRGQQGVEHSCTSATVLHTDEQIWHTDVACLTVMGYPWFKACWSGVHPIIEQFLKLSKSIDDAHHR